MEQDTKYGLEEDLAKSGLDPHFMRARLIDNIERAACHINNGIDGYVIPYFGLDGKPLPYYRCRLFNADPKYKQVKNSTNHVYFPPTFRDVFARHAKAHDKPYIVVTEGEKKAACLVARGIPCIAFGGVDSWQNKTIILPSDTELVKMSLGKQVITARVPDQGYAENDLYISPLARGLEDLFDFGLEKKVTFIIIYDSDMATGIKPQVQRAAARFGYELRFNGYSINQIRQLVLPPILDGKVAVDDYVMHPKGGVENLQGLIQKTMAMRTAFPRHPNVREHINKKLQKSKMHRKDLQNLALCLVTELDARGHRMYAEKEQELYYFDQSTSRLCKAPLNSTTNDRLQGTTFGKLLYTDYGISPSADSRFMQWFSTQFAAEAPIEKVTPHKVFARPLITEDIVRYQISDSQYVKISAENFDSEELDILDNGAEGILFESNCCSPLDPSKLLEHYQKYITQSKEEAPINQWFEVMKHVRLKEMGKQAQLISLLYYISPWLFRWRGTQLPVELVLGESGSGKSTLCNLRMNIINGIPELRNAPQDLKDWHASITNTGGLHVTDNVQLVDKNLRQRLSDEICRLITEPDPHVEMRKYFTNADLMQIAVNSVFCFTAIAQPFLNNDLIQRAVILELDQSGTEVTSFDSDWEGAQIKHFGGREAWAAHHLVVLTKFFKAVKEHWDPRYKAQHRLINFEQILVILTKYVFEEDASWIPGHLSGSITKIVATTDWVLEGLLAFAESWKKSGQAEVMFGTSELSNWAQRETEFSDCHILVNSRSLGRYIQNHKQMIKTVCGIVESGRGNNRALFKIQ